MERDFIVYVKEIEEGLCIECCVEQREDAVKRVMVYGSQMGRSMSN